MPEVGDLGSLGAVELGGGRAGLGFLPPLSSVTSAPGKD